MVCAGRRVCLFGALLVSAGCGARSLGTQTGTTPFREVDRVASASAHAYSARDPVAVTYAGPHTLLGRVSLGARVHSETRIVAATFMLAGRPLGTVTGAPWALDVDAALLPAGTAPLTVIAVDRLGQRAASPATNLRVLRGREHLLRASPQRHLVAALRSLAHGSVTVYLSPGRYRINEIALGPGARLIGSGPATILTPSAGASHVALLSIRSSHVRFSDLAVDGAGQIDEAVSIGEGASDVRIQRIEVSGVRVNGVAVWGAHSNVSIQDSTLVGGGAALNAGVFDVGSDHSSQTSVVRTLVSGFRGYGVLFAQRFYGLEQAAWRNLALDNRIAHIIDPVRHDGTDGGGIWTGGVQAAVIGNAVSDTSTDGIETVGSSTADTIIANRVQHTPVAVYVEHSTNQSLVAANQITDAGTGINVEWRHAGGGSNANTFSYNRIAARLVGVFVDVQEDYNTIVGNFFTNAKAMPIVLQGSSHNVVRTNVACGAGSRPFVVQQPARSQTGAMAQSSDNRLIDNARTSPCTAA